MEHNRSVWLLTYKLILKTSPWKLESPGLSWHLLDTTVPLQSYTNLAHTQDQRSRLVHWPIGPADISGLQNRCVTLALCIGQLASSACSQKTKILFIWVVSPLNFYRTHYQLTYYHLHNHFKNWQAHNDNSTVQWSWSLELWLVTEHSTHLMKDVYTYLCPRDTTVTQTRYVFSLRIGNE